MANIKVAVINSSTVLTDDEVSAAVPALQQQVSDDFAPIWGIDALLTFVPSTGVPDPDLWWLVVLDNSDQAGALGYHDLTDQGLPLGKVFAGTDQAYGSSWTVTASHELLEMLADPDINLTAFVQTTNTGGRLYAYEVADACEADAYGYLIDGTLVSDFVYPTWFEAFWGSSATKFDRGNHIQNPFELLPGGYIGAFDVSGGSGWYPLYGHKDGGADVRYSMRAHVGSRRERRRTPRSQWLPSVSRQIVDQHAPRQAQPVGR